MKLIIYRSSTNPALCYVCWLVDAFFNTRARTHKYIRARAAPYRQLTPHHFGDKNRQADKSLADFICMNFNFHPTALSDRRKEHFYFHRLPLSLFSSRTISSLLCISFYVNFLFPRPNSARLSVIRHRTPTAPPRLFQSLFSFLRQ